MSRYITFYHATNLHDFFKINNVNEKKRAQNIIFMCLYLFVLGCHIEYVIIFVFAKLIFGNYDYFTKR